MRACYMSGCAELSWHTAANYFPGFDEQAHIQKSKQEIETLFSTKVSSFQLLCHNNRPCLCQTSVACTCCSIIYITLAIKIYFALLMFGLSLILAAKQTLGLNLRIFVMLACSSPTLEMRARVMRLERLTKTNL